VSNGPGRVTTYQYDANGNRVLETAPDGSTIERVFDLTRNNQLMSEKLTDPRDPHGVRVTRYGYNAQGRLRFVVSPENRLTEFIYNAQGQRTSVLEYGEALYTSAGDITETAFNSWNSSNGRRDTFLRRTDSTYDARGNLATVTQYSAIIASGARLGEGDESDPVNKPFNRTTYVYDHAGRLLATSGSRGDSATYTYDGLGRVLMAVSTTSTSASLLSTYSYDDAGHTVATVTGTALMVQRYDAAGALQSVAMGQGAASVTQYLRDGAGRVRKEIDPTGNEKLYLYDAAGRNVATILEDGTFTEYFYSKSDQLLRTVRYATPIGDAQRAALAATDAAGTPLLFRAINDRTGLRPDSAPQSDRVTWTLYDELGRATKAIDEYGYVTETLYDARGNVQATLRYETALAPTILASLTHASRPQDLTLAVTDQTRIRRYTYDKDGNQTGMIDEEGYLTEYVRGASSNVLAVTQEIRYGQRIRAEAAAGPNAASVLRLKLDSTIRPGGGIEQVTNFFYDAQGRVRAMVKPQTDGYYLTEHRYNGAGDRIATLEYGNKLASFSTSDTLEQVVQKAVTANPNPAQHIRKTASTYTRQGQLESETSPEGVVTLYAYDEHGRLLTRTVAHGTADARTTRREYDELGRVAREYDGENKLTSYDYDSAGRLLRKTDASLNVTRYFYDGRGQLRYSVNDLGEVAATEYNATGQTTRLATSSRRLSATQVAGLQGGFVTSALSLAVQALFDPARDSVQRYEYGLRGELVHRSDSDGRDMVSGYNAFGDMSTQVQTGAAAMSMAYDRRGLRTGTTAGPVGAQISTSAEYDGFGRLRVSVDARGAITTNEYDKWNRLVRVNGPKGIAALAYDTYDRVVRRTDEFGAVTTIAYDSAARSMTVTSPEGVIVTTINNAFGEQWKVIASTGDTRTYLYDHNGRLLETRDADGVAVDLRTYDGNGNLESVRDALGRATAYTYDAANRVLTRTVDPAGLALATVTTYDGQGRVLTTIDPAGVKTVMTYTSTGLLEAVAIDPDGLNLRTLYAYDNGGRLQRRTEGAGSAEARITEYRYDAHGRKEREIAEPDGLALATRYVYDRAGNVVARTDPAGRVSRYSYDNAGRMVWEIDPDGTAAQYTYETVLGGPLVIKTSHIGQFDLALNVFDLTVMAGAPANWAQTLIRPSGGLGANRTEMTRYDKDGRLQYASDALGQITKYTYDAQGGLARVRQLKTTKQSTLPGFDIAEALEDRITDSVRDKHGRVRFEVDANGYVKEHIYNAAGQVERTVEHSERVQRGAALWQESELAQLVAGTEGDRVRVNTYDTAARLLTETDVYGNLTRYYYDGAGNVAGTLRHARGAASTPGADMFMLSVRDGAGRVLYEVDGAGYVKRYDRDALGRVVRQTAYAVPIGAQSGVLDAADVAGLLQSSALDRRQIQVYNAAGNVAYSISEQGYVTASTYDAAGRLTYQRKYADAIALGASMPGAAELAALPASPQDQQRALFYNVDGTVRAEVDSAGMVTSYAYDSFGQAWRTTRHANAVAWNASVSLADQVEQRIAAITNADARSYAQYDA
ncbi:MAG TPA: hypothetical protein VIT92_06165, partial [Burkholderiaceae bacterium]